MGKRGPWLTTARLSSAGGSKLSPRKGLSSNCCPSSWGSADRHKGRVPGTQLWGVQRELFPPHTHWASKRLEILPKRNVKQAGEVPPSQTRFDLGNNEAWDDLRELLASVLSHGENWERSSCLRPPEAGSMPAGAQDLLGNASSGVGEAQSLYPCLLQTRDHIPWKAAKCESSGCLKYGQN